MSREGGGGAAMYAMQRHLLSVQGSGAGVWPERGHQLNDIHLAQLVCHAKFDWYGFLMEPGLPPSPAKNGETSILTRQEPCARVRPGCGRRVE